MIIAGFALFEAVLRDVPVPGHAASASAWRSCPRLILWYLSTADVKAAFAEGQAAA